MFNQPYQSTKEHNKSPNRFMMFADASFHLLHDRTFAILTGRLSGCITVGDTSGEPPPRCPIHQGLMRSSCLLEKITIEHHHSQSTTAQCAQFCPIIHESGGDGNMRHANHNSNMKWLDQNDSYRSQHRQTGQEKNSLSPNKIALCLV